MNIIIDTTLSSIHVGQCRRVVTLGLNGKDRAHEFLTKLNKDDHRKWVQLITRIATIADYPSYENQQTFRYLEEGIFEFKRPGLRLYAFY
ncbi:MAG: hypothetical protein JJU20_15175 [Opitutales bacterium]|nr:hypothetical protein [Opitutales bacterium]